MKTHRFDPLSFISGALAVLAGLAFLIPAEPADIFDVVRELGAWFWPTVLVIIGIAILAPLAYKSTDGGEEQD